MSVIREYSVEYTLHGLKGVQHFLLCGEEDYEEPKGHIILDCFEEFPIFHVMNYRQTPKVLYSIRNELHAVIQKYIVEMYDYNFMLTVQNDQRYLDFLFNKTPHTVEKLEKTLDRHFYAVWLGEK